MCKPLFFISQILASSFQTEGANIMQNAALAIKSYPELTIATRTNKPIVAAPEEFQSEITKTATKYINLYPRRYTDREVVGIMELLPIVRNRIENLTVEGLAAGTISKPADVTTLLKGNAKMEALEEKAIIEAYHNGVENAALYVYLFFSFKVADFMSTSKLFGTSNEQDMYSSLQVYLYTLVEKFDFNIIQNGGLSTKYYRQAMCDYVRETLIGKNYSLFSLNRRQVSDLRKAQHITTQDSRTLSYEELAKKYGITKVAVSLHFLIMGTVRLDSSVMNDDGDRSDNYENFSDGKDAFEEVEAPINCAQMFICLERENIEAAVAKSILAALLAYADQSRAERGYTKKASKNVYRNIAREVSVPLNVVETVVHTYQEMCA
jgi:hypothetical protein